MLRASSASQNQTIAIKGVLNPSETETGIEAEDLLIAFTEAVVRRDPAVLAPARDALQWALGGDAVVDAAAVIGNFERMNRIADACGIAVDDMMLDATKDLRADLAIDHFGSAVNTLVPPDR